MAKRDEIPCKYKIGKAVRHILDQDFIRRNRATAAVIVLVQERNDIGRDQAWVTIIQSHKEIDAASFLQLGLDQVREVPPREVGEDEIRKAEQASEDPPMN